MVEVLHPADDLPLHPTPAPLLHPVSDSPGLYDRYFHNGFTADGSLFFAVALGVYPNRQVMDASFAVVLDGVQHNVRASRRCSTDRTVTTVGGIAVTVVDPMLEHRVTVDGSQGVAADLVWRAGSPVIEEPRFTRLVDGRPILDYTRITQFGSWSGWIDVDGTRLEIGPDTLGCRDRSWGVRGGSGLPGPATVPQFHWLWVPTMLDDLCAHVAVNEDGDGRAWHRSGAIAGRLDAPSLDEVLDDSRVRRTTHSEVDVVWSPGTRWMSSATVRHEQWRDDEIEITYEPVLRFQMSGIGYLHPEWGHGSWHGELAETRDSIDLASVDPADPTMVHIQQVCRATSGERSGVGVFEQLVIGPHAPSGFSGLTDGAT